jgi:hypothetical protein
VTIEKEVPVRQMHSTSTATFLAMAAGGCVQDEPAADSGQHGFP